MVALGRQLPEPGEIYLDHVGWMVPDMDAATRAFTRLGFALTPYSLHGNQDPETGRIVAQGSANRLAMLERGYLEILTPVAGADTAMARHLKDSIGRYVGVHLIAFAVADADAEAERLASAGFRLQATVNLRRTIEAADGSQAQVAFTVVRARFGSIPEGRLQVLTHLTPEHLWQERYIARDNAITGLCEAVLAVPDPEASAGRLARFTGRGVRETEGGGTISLDRGRLTFSTPEAVARRYGGLRSPPVPAMAAVGLVSRDLDRTRGFLLGRDVGLLVDEPERLIVDPQDALGAALVIEPEKSG
jgi:catechol 2,3-dioxygenase-like lactoylglutathione lyase family enzyme